ncbi:MAG: hypothetical protein JNJ41_13420 [Bacteroidia bacterium]|nr:hypothetical protein [Bacteroidia bacterium]
MKSKIITVFLLLSLVTAKAQFNLKKPNLSIGKGDKTENHSDSKVQTYIEGAKASIEKLNAKLDEANWANSSFERGYASELENLESKINSIKRDDPNYKISDFEEKYKYFSNKQNEGLAKQKEENKKVAEASLSAEKAKEKEKFDDLHKKIKDEGITNVTHQKYLQKIVFSKTEISKTSPNENSFASDFQIASPIYFRIYLKECLYNTHVVAHDPSIIENQGGLWCKIFLDGKLAWDKSFALNGNVGKYLKPEEKKTLTTLGGILNFKDENLGSYEYIKTMIENENSLTPGNHSFRMEIYPKFMSDDRPTDELLASGEFNLNVTSNFVDRNNYVVCMPTSKKKDLELEAKFTARLKEYFIANKEKVELKKFVLRSSEWEIEKHEITGKILSKTMYGAAGLSKDGKCIFKVFSFTQFWDGNGYQSTISVESTGGQGDVFCDCLK